MHVSDFLILAVLDFLANVIIAYAWPFVVLATLWIFRETIRESVENFVSRITSVTVTGKDVAVGLGKPQLPPLRELNVFDTVALGGSCSTSARLLSASLGTSSPPPLPACITGYTDLNYRRNTSGYYEYSNRGQVWGSPAYFGPTEKPPGSFIT